MPSIDSLAEEYVERAAALDPSYATSAGIAGHEHELPDLSADGFAGRAELDRSTLAALDAADALLDGAQDSDGGSLRRHWGCRWGVAAGPAGGGFVGGGTWPMTMQ